MTMDQWEYGDPMEVAARREVHEQRQQAACGACIHHLQLIVGGKTAHACDAGRRYGTRCEQYRRQKGST